MRTIYYGRKTFSFAGGEIIHRSTSITEKPLPRESESAFINRLLQKYEAFQGTLEIIIKDSCPNYAIITYLEVADIQQNPS